MDVLTLYLLTLSDKVLFDNIFFVSRFDQVPYMLVKRTDWKYTAHQRPADMGIVPSPTPANDYRNGIKKQVEQSIER